MDHHVYGSHVPREQFTGRFREYFQIPGRDKQGKLTGPVRFWQNGLAEFMRRVPGEKVLRAGFVKEQLWCTDAGQSICVIGAHVSDRAHSHCIFSTPRRAASDATRKRPRSDLAILLLSHSVGQLARRIASKS